MGTLNFRFQEHEIQQLIQKYKLDETSGLINYFKFCDNIDKVFGEELNSNQVLQHNKSTAVLLLTICALTIIVELHRSRKDSDGECA